MKRTFAIVFALTGLISQPVFAQTAGTANAQGEAPGGGPLAQLPPPSTPSTPAAQPSPNDPAASRSMAFAPNSGECRETVPGGPMLAIAYAIVLLIFGAYLGILARKNARLVAAVDELEKEIERGRGKRGAKEPAA